MIRAGPLRATSDRAYVWIHASGDPKTGTGPGRTWASPERRRVAESGRRRARRRAEEGGAGEAARGALARKSGDDPRAKHVSGNPRAGGRHKPFGL
jgi:hypothetical protein